MPAHPLTNFEIKNYYENEPRFNGVYSRDNLPKTIKNGAYVIYLDEYEDVGTHWIALYSILLVQNMFLRRFRNLLNIKISKQTYSEYKQAIQ